MRTFASQNDLFTLPVAAERAMQALPSSAELGQYPTPFWVAEALVARHFGKLDANDFVIEPSCGPGSFLNAVPEHVPACGVEIDVRMVDLARRNTRRQIIQGDFRTVELDVQPTAIIGNPPFNMKLVDGFLHRSHELLPEGGRVGMILPAYAMQTASRVAGYAETWSLFQEAIPRNIFPNLQLPLLFAIFSKDRRRTMVGFALYRELAALQQIERKYRDMMNATGKSVWRDLVAEALQRLGGRAHLDAIYAEVEGRRPSGTKWWREGMRRTLRRHADLFRPHGKGIYSLATT